MTYSVTVLPSGRKFHAEADETLLDAALRSGLAFPYGCRGGACGSCVGKVVSGEIHYGDDEPMALSDEEQTVGMALFCLARPNSDITLEVHEVGAIEEIPIRNLPAKVARLERMNDEVMALFLKLPEGERLQYLAGQYADFIMKDGRKRPFSIANAPHHDELLEFHIRHIRGGEFTDHVFSDMQPGEMLRIEAPKGSFFLREDSDRPIIMLATGTGFGPIKGILEHMMAEQSTRPVTLYWGARHREDLYADGLIRSWQTRFPTLDYRPVLSQPDSSWDGRSGYVQEAVSADFADLSNHELYACGHPAMVYSARDALVARGMDPAHCFGDAFEWAKD
ncbi:MAG: CDP-6-deoxy-delta-3,4-glucoseen reductase [Chromatiales bacterium]|nr:CDP-6-deoxy-delta-3,4-glucoseen reductase [Gammaproteobacteria bacterium]MBW6476072.1 CDP-6-deoxy-delta-3,4-glucoseen reductase [Chromatiales bacterium]